MTRNLRIASLHLLESGLLEYQGLDDGVSRPIADKLALIHAHWENPELQALLDCIAAADSVEVTF